MPKFRKRPIEIEAEQFLGEPIFGLNDIRVNPFLYGDGRTLFVPTNAGRITAQIGDWVVKSANGKFSVCLAGIFEATYAACGEESIVFVFSPSHDWMVVFKGNEQLDAGHSVSARELLRKLGYPVVTLETTEEFADEGCWPDKLNAFPQDVLRHVG